jgi:hypothetical protein
MKNKTIRNNWCEINLGLNGVRFIYALASYFDNRHMLKIGLGFVTIYLHLPFKSGIDDCEYPEYGFYWYGDPGHHSLWFCWGMKKYSFYMPWSSEWVRTSALRIDGKWEHETRGDKGKDFWDNEKWKDILYVKQYPYIYTLKGGTVQNRTATIRVEEREWRWKWFTWLPLTKRVKKTISVDFDAEVGEETGSWKGGCTGCGYNMLKGETPVATLRRMEKERKF